MPSKATPARRKAYECLEVVRRRNAFADDVIDKRIDGSGMSPSDKAFATRLVLGVVSTQGTLDKVIDRALRSPSDVKPDVRDALRISTYEIVFLGKEPHAAVDQGVELVRHVQPRAARLANSVLRKVSREARSFPFGDPSKDLEAYALLHAFPAWLAALLVRDLGPEEANAFMRASNEPAPTYIFLSDLKGQAQASMEALEEAGCRLHPVKVCGVHVEGCYRLDDAKGTSTEAFRKLADEGDALVSDASAQLIAQLACKAALMPLSWPGGEGDPADAPADTSRYFSCLELCSGRGTKTILLQNAARTLAGRQFDEYVAVDNVEFKARLLEERARLFGAHVGESLCADVLDAPGALAGRTFDLVFLDAPCTGLGTLRRHPEIRWRVSPGVIEEDALRDAHLLRAASEHVAPGGVLVYSTCTITRAEDEDAVESFLSSDMGPMFEPVALEGSPFLRTRLSMGGHDAHFCAILRRKVVR